MSSVPAVVAISVYKSEMTDLERLSLDRCATILGCHPLAFFGPDTLDYALYRASIPSARIVTFDERYFRSLGGYSELLVQPHFYETFADYDFLLIYQLDAFVFEDRLLEWCGRGYDFIGAPWLGPDGQWTGVGNGGFSLRKVRSCLDVLNSPHTVDPAVLWAHIRRTTPHLWVRLLKYHRKVLAHLGWWSDVGTFLRRWVKREEPEDMFWGLHAIRYWPPFRVAPPEEAIRFAVEAGLEKCRDVWSERPPFGCHRNRFLEMIARYLHSTDAPRDDGEQLTWDMARAAGLERMK